MRGSKGRIGAVPDAATRCIAHPAGFAAPKPIASAVALALLALNAFHTQSAYAAPAGEQLVGGAASVLRPNAQTTVIDQTSQRAALNWTSFGIAAGESVVFNQPSARSVILNRVMGSEASHIYGSLQANGQVFLVNPNGVTFARGASVDVGGIVASTLGITNNDFMAGRYVFSGGSAAGAIENHTNIRAANGGYVAFLGNQVTNTGKITAPGGTVAFGAGDMMQLDFHGDGLLTLKVDTAAANAKLENRGVIAADGGQVFLTARVKNALVSTAINMDGVITAKGLAERNGRIVLDGGRSGVTSVSGTLDASSANAGQKGGDIRVLGEYVGLLGNAKLDASGMGGGGTVLLGGDFQGRNADVQNAFRTYVGPDATIKADAITSGDGGKVIVWADDTTRFYGSISARGGAESGNGGFVEVSGKGHLVFEGVVDTSALHGNRGTLLLDPSDIDISNGAQADIRTQVATPAAGTVTFDDSPADVGGAASPSILNIPTLQAALAANNVIVTTVSGETDAGNIRVLNDVTWATANSLTLTATNGITINAGISGTNGALVLNAAGAGGITQTTGTINVASLNATSAGTIDQTGGNMVVSGATTLTATNAITASLTSGTNNFNTVALANAGGFFTTASVTDGVNAMSIGGSAGTLDAVAAGQLTLTGGTYTTLNATSQGGIDQSTAPLIVSGVTTLTASTNAGQTFDLSTQNNNFGSVVLNPTVAITTASVTDAVDGMSIGGSATTLSASSVGQLTLTGGTYTTLNATSLGGINQSTAPLLVSGVTTLTADTTAAQTFNLSTQNNNFSSVVLAAANAGTTATASVTDTVDAMSIGGSAGTFNATAAGALTLTGGTYTTLNASGASVGQTGTFTATNITGSATAGAATLTLNNAITNIGPFSTTAGLSVTDGAGGDGLTVAGALTGGTGAVTLATTQGNLIANNTITGTGVDLSTTVAGSLLTIGADVDAGTGAVTLTAGGLNSVLTNNANVAAATTATLTADQMVLGGKIATTVGGTGKVPIVTLRPNTAGQLIDLGGADAAGMLGLTQAELDTVNANILRVGSGTAGGITVSSDVTFANADALHLISGGGVTATAGGVVVPGLAIDAAGTVNMTDSSTNITTLAANVTGGNTFTLINEVDGFAVGAVDGVTGLATANAIATLGTLGPLSVNQAIATGTGTVSLQGAAILQSGAGSITADALATDSTGSTALNLTTNNVNTYAGRSSVNGNVRYADADGFTVGTVAGIIGVSTNNQALRLQTGAAGGDLTISSAINAGTASATLFVQSGSIGQGAGGTITAGTLGTLSRDTVTLDQVGNNVGTLAGVVSGAGQNFTYRDADSFVVGTAGDLPASGITTHNGIVTLQSTNGGITQTAGAIITAGTLTGSAASNVTLDQNNAIGNLGAFSIVGGLTLNDVGGLRVTGAVTTNNNGPVSITTSGPLAVTGTGSIDGIGVTLVATGAGANISLDNDVNARTGTLTLTADGAGASITQSVGTLTAATLTGSTNTTAALNSATNAITDLGAFTTSGNFTLNDVGGLTVAGAVNSGSGFASITTSADLSVTTGTITASGATLVATGANSDILLGNNVNAGSGTLTLTASGAGAMISQTGGALSAGTLTGSSNTSTSLTLLPNAITNLGNFTTGTVFEIGDSGGLTVTGAVVSGGVASITTSGDLSVTSGSVTGTGVTLVATGAGSDILLGNSVNAGGGTLNLVANQLGALISQTAGTLTAGTLTGSTNTTATLNQPTNAITNLGAFTTGTGLTLVDAGGIAVTGNVIGGTGPVSVTTSGDLSVTTGTVAGTGVTLVATGAGSDILLGNTVNADTGTASLTAETITGSGLVSGANVALDAATGVGTGTAGRVNTAAGTVAARTRTSGGVFVNEADAVSINAVGAVVNASAGTYDVISGGAMTVDGAINATNAGSIALATGAAANLTLNANLDAGAGNVALNAGGDISQAAGIVNTAGTLSGSAGAATLNQANTIANVGPFTTTGAFTLNDASGGLTIVGDISAGAGAVTITAAGANSLLTNNANIASTTSVELNADRMSLGGSIATTAGGAGKVPLVVLQPVTAGQAISLGGADVAGAPGTLGVTQAEFNTINANTLRLGRTNAGAITVDTPITLTTIDNLRLVTGSAISGSGSVNVSGLLLESASSSNVSNPNNEVITLAGRVGDAGQPFTYIGVGSGVIVGTIDGINGITTNNGNVSVATTGTLTLNQPIVAGSGAVALQGASITSNGTTGSVTANALSSVSTTGSTLLHSASNDVTSYSGQANTAGSTITFVDPNGFNVTGITTAGSEARLIASAGAITQTAGTIAAGQLSVVARDTSSFTLAGNDIGTLSASVTGANQSLTYRDSNGFTAGLTGLAPAGANAIQTNAGNVTLTADTGTMTIANPIAAAGTTVTLNATAGAIAQNAGGGVTAETLTGTAGTSAALTGNNAIINLGAFTTNGAFTLNDAGGLNVTGAVTTQNGGAATVATGGTLAVTTGSVSGAGVALTTTAGGDITLNGPINGNAGDVALTSAGLISQTATGLINTTGALTGSAATTAALNQANTVASVGPFTTNGNFTLNDMSGGLTLTGSVAAGSGAVSITTAGGPLALQSTNVSGIGGVTLEGVGVTSTGGSVSTTAAANSGVASGAIQITATGTGAASLGGTLDSHGADHSAGQASAGGNVTVTTNDGAVTVAAVNARGGDASAIQTNSGGGNAGTITYNVGGGNVLTLNGDQNSRGGNAPTSGLIGQTGTAGSGRDFSVTAPTRLGADVTITTRYGSGIQVTFATAGNVSFGSTIESAATPHSLTIAPFVGTATFQGAIGGNGNPLSSLMVGAASGINLNGGSVTTTAAQTYDLVRLGADTTLTSIGGGNIALFGVLSPGTARDLSVNTAGVTTFNSSVGGGPGNALRSITTDAAGSTVFNGILEVITTATQTYNDPATFVSGLTLTSGGSGASGDVTFGSTLQASPGGALSVNTGGTTTFGGAVGGNGNPLFMVTTDSAGTTAINGGAVTTTSGQFFNDPVTLGADTVLTVTDGDVTFKQTVESPTTPRSLVVNARGITDFTGAVGGNSNPLLSITTDTPGSTAINGGAVTTTGAQTYNDPVTLGADTTLASTIGTAVTFGGTVNGPFALTVNAGPTTFNGAVGGTAPLTSLTTDVLGTTAINGGAITTTGAQTFNDPVWLGANATLTSTGGGTLTFANTLAGPGGLVANSAGETIFGGSAVGFPMFLASVTTDSAGVTRINGGNITTTGPQTFNDNVTLGENAGFFSTGAGNIAFAGTLQSSGTPRALEVGTAGTVVFGGAVGGGGNPLLSLIASAAGGTVVVNGGAITTTGFQIYNTNPVVLGADTTFSSTAAGPLSFGGAVNGSFALIVNTASATNFGGAVGGTAPLRSLTTDAGGTTAIDGGAITTTGAQTFNDPVALGANTVLASTGGGALTFASTLEGPGGLVATSGGATTFGGAVGGNNKPLASLVTDAPGTTVINGGGVSTVGNQSYLDTVTLGSANTLLGSTGAIAFGNTLDGASNLTLTAAGATTFGGTVGGVAALTSLTTNGGGTTAVNGAGVRTTAAQMYTDAVTLGAADSLFTSTGNQPISFAGTVNGASNLTVTSAGLTTFGGAVGDAAPLTSLTTNGGGTTALNGSLVATAANQSYGDIVTFGANPALSSSAGSIAFASTIDADAAAMNRKLTASAPTGTVAFSGNIGATQALADLDVTASSIVFSAGGAQSVNVSAQGGNTATFAGPVTLAQNLAFNTTGAGDNNVTFANTVNADAFGNNRTLNVATGTGSATFADGVGTGQELGAFTVAGNQLVMSGDVRVNGGGAVDFTNLANMRFTPGASIDTDRAGGATAAGNILFGAATRANPTAAGATWTLDANADGGGAAGNVSLGTIGNLTGLNVLNVIGDRVTFAGPVNAVQVFVTANKVESTGDGRIFATRGFDGTAEAQAALSLRALTGEGSFGERNAPIQISAPGLFFVLPNGSNTLSPVFLAGDPNLRPVYQFAEDPSGRLVFYNGAAPDSPANRSAQSAITQQLRQLLDEINQAGFSKENIRRQLLQGVILETGLSRPGIDDFVGEGVTAPPSCNAVMGPGGKIDCP